MVSFCCSLWQSVPGEEAGRQGQRPPVRHEGAEEGDHRAEKEDDGAHEDGAAGAGGGARQSVSGHVALRLPNGCQAASHPR